MQVILNIPDNLPLSIVQQYIGTIETQMRLIANLTNNNAESIEKKNTVSLKRGSAKKDITFIVDDFTDTVDDFKDYMS